MRHRRLKAPASFPVAYYHCLSRVVDRQFVFGELEREQFLKYLREYETFCGVRVLTYCILSNHFHLLIEVPAKPTVPLTAEELLTKLEALSSTALTAATARQRLTMFRQANDTAGEREFIDRLCATMWDVSGFMQRLKQRFTQWFNRHRGRKGTLWEERFKSVLVEGAGETLSTMAAYIDLNPVRAGMVADPKDYRWCGYGAAVAGDRRARTGLRVIIAGGEREEKLSIPDALAKYRVWLFGEGEEKEGFTETGQPLRQGFKRDEVLAVAAAEGQLALEDYLRLKVRYFSDGAVLGTRAFVNEVFATLRERFSPKRQDGARPMAGLKNKLFTLRELRDQVFG
ncbi:MAG TPA: transposase [Verrucomicrobiota bacterium]|nr:chemotaxis protein CheW [Verrucomicrobiales bacterium]HRI14586.1 transposase [Verrucomicrobiota bacterium]